MAAVLRACSSVTSANPQQNHLTPLTVGKPLCQGGFCIYQATMFLNVYFQVLYGVARLPFSQGQSEGQTLIFSHKIAPLKGNLPLSFFHLDIL